MAKIIVTGGAGFIGSHLTDALVSAGHRVTVIDNLMLGNKKFVNKKAKFVKADIRNFALMKKNIRGTDVVFHLAADPRLPLSIEDPKTTHEINVTGTLNVLEAARLGKVKKVVFSSSCAVYGDQNSVPFVEDMTPNPLNPYSLHKLMGEEYCRLYSSLFGLETVCLRYFNVFGPRKLATGSYPMVIPIFLDQKKRGQKLTVVGDGNSTRDYVHVSDVVRANIAAWESKIGDGGVYNVGTGRQVSVNEIARLIGGKTKTVPARRGEMRYVEANNKKAWHDLGWTPQMKFENGLEALKKDWQVK